MKLVYQLNNLYFIGFITDSVFYCDKREFDKNRKLKNDKISKELPEMKKAET